MMFSRFRAIFLAAAVVGVVGMSAPTLHAQASFKSSDPAFSSIVEGVARADNRTAQRNLARAVMSGAIDSRGTRVTVPNARLERTGTGRQSPMPDRDLRWHNPLGGVYQNPISSRWYQRDGNTQVFRVFPGDENWSSARVGAARSEAFAPQITTVETDGKTLTFSARFHVASHNGSREVMLFQSKGRDRNTLFREQGALEYPAWSIALFVQPDGRVVLRPRNPRGGKGTPIQTGFGVGQSFNLRVVDDGLNYRAFINNKLLASGQWKRGDTPTVARWGAYIQQGPGVGVLEGSLREPQVVFVSGARVTLR